MAAFAAHGGDVAAEGLAYPQPIQGQQRDQRVVLQGPHTGGQGRARVRAVQGGVGVVVQAGAADLRGERVVEEVFLDGAAVEISDRADLAGNPAASLPLAIGVRLVEYRGHFLIVPVGCCDVGEPDKIRRDPCTEPELMAQPRCSSAEARSTGGLRRPHRCADEPGVQDSAGSLVLRVAEPLQAV